MYIYNFLHFITPQNHNHFTVSSTTLQDMIIE